MILSNEIFFTLSFQLKNLLCHFLLVFRPLHLKLKKKRITDITFVYCLEQVAIAIGRSKLQCSQIKINVHSKEK